jgi:integrase
MSDLVPLSPCPPNSQPPTPNLDLAIAAWLAAKFRRSGSEHTRRAYSDTLASFRVAIVANGFDLDGNPQAVALAAQGWAGLGDPAPATFNRRLAVLSSFYAFAIKRGVFFHNPIDLVDRAYVELYGQARALDPAELRERLAAIDRSDLAGARDFALLALYLQTGRRLAEILSLRWGDLEVRGGRVTIHVRRAKGGKQMSDLLPVGVGQALLAWLRLFYGADLEGLAEDTPLWVNLARNGRGQPLTSRGVAGICLARLGTSKIHSLRHTFAHAMEAAGAKVSDIQARLGHASLATTGRYLAALKRAENAQADVIAELFGLG